jgi:hypothetical protein
MIVFDKSAGLADTAGLRFLLTPLSLGILPDGILPVKAGLPVT